MKFEQCEKCHHIKTKVNFMMDDNRIVAYAYYCKVCYKNWQEYSAELKNERLNNGNKIKT